MNSFPADFLAANPLVGPSGRYIHDPKAFEERLARSYVPALESVDACPVCEGTAFDGLDYPAHYRPTEALFLANEKISQKLQRCNRCGLIMVRNVLSGDFYFEYINSVYDNQKYPQTPETVAEVETFYRQKHAFIRDFALRDLSSGRPRPRLLEVSSFVGTGIADLAADFDVFGLEAENAPALFAVQTYPQLKHRIVNDVLENSLATLSACGPFDVVLFMYAFRQIARPGLVLQWLRQALVPGGIVVMAESLFSDFIFDEIPANVGRHFYHNKSCYYNIPNLTALMARHGFSFIKSEFYGAERAKLHFDQSAVLFRFDGAEHQPVDLDAARSLSDRIFQYFLAATKRE